MTTLSDLFAAILALFRSARAPSLSSSSAASAAPTPAAAAPAPVVKPVVPVPVMAPAVVAKSEAPTLPIAPAAPHWIDLCRPMTEYFERCVLIAYPDPASALGEAIQARGQWEHVLNGAAIPQDLIHLDGAPWTCGYGCTGPDISHGTVWTQTHADSQLTVRLNQAADAVDAHVKVDLTPAQKAALTDFVFNEGEGNFASSTLLRLLNASDFVAAAAQFGRWDLAKGKVLPGLDARRAAEKQLFTTGQWRPA
jgi:lysozyme